MKRIQKNSTEPKSLVEYRSTPGVNFGGYVKGEDFKNSILGEQGYICCYCMKRISKENLTIEHYKTQHNNPELQLVYSNMLGSCDGGSKKSHCNPVRKGNQELTINPLSSSANCEDQIKYTDNGIIFSDNKIYDHELSKVLCLNDEFLRLRRESIYEATKLWCKIQKNKGKMTPANLRKKIKSWQTKKKGGDGECRHEEYCQVAIYVLTKKLKKQEFAVKNKKQS